MRVLVMIYEFPPVGGGGGRAARDICQRMAAQGHEVKVLTTHLKGLPRQEIQSGVEIVRVPAGRQKAFVASFLDMGGYVVSGIAAGLRLLPKFKPDLIHVHFAVPSGPAAWVLSKIFKVPYVLTAHLGDVPGGVPEKTRAWFRYVYPFTRPIWRDAAKVVAVSEFTRQLALVHYPVDIRIIPNGVDIKDLDPGEIRLNTPPQIIFAARLMPQKNPVQLIHALAGVADLPWKCLILGDGPLRQDVEQAIAAQNLQNRIEMAGWVTPEEVLASYRRSDILFMPSLSEGFPLTGVQGLAMGLAVIASRVGGFVDLIKDGENGLLYAPDDLAGMQTGLRSLLTNPDLLEQMRLTSRTMSGAFDLNRIVGEYEAIFRSILSYNSVAEF